MKQIIFLICEKKNYIFEQYFPLFWFLDVKKLGSLAVNNATCIPTFFQFTCENFRSDPVTPISWPLLIHKNDFFINFGWFCFYVQFMESSKSNEKELLIRLGFITFPLNTSKNIFILYQHLSEKKFQLKLSFLYLQSAFTHITKSYNMARM